MASTGKDIITAIEKEYPKTGIEKIPNCSDLHLEIKDNVYHQFIFGVGGPDPMSGDFGHYKANLLNHLPYPNEWIKFLAWTYEEYEEQELRDALYELSEFYEANLQIDRMIDEAKRWKPRRYYLFVSVVRIPVVTVG